MQSKENKVAAKVWYDVALREVCNELRQITTAPTPTQHDQEQDSYVRAEDTPKDPWLRQVRRTRRSTGPHNTKELLRIWKCKIMLYRRWWWQKIDRNRHHYRESCSIAQLRERNLVKERARRDVQRIQKDPEALIAKPLQDGAQERRRQDVLDYATGKQLKPREFAEMLCGKSQHGEAIALHTFTVDAKQHTYLLFTKICDMANNKAVGTDGVHAEMIRVNTVKTAEVLTWIWTGVGRTRIMPKMWLEGVIVPLFKGK